MHPGVVLRNADDLTCAVLGFILKVHCWLPDSYEFIDRRR